MGRLAFSGEGRYAQYDDAYDLYLKRSKSESALTFTQYKRVVREYCKLLAERMEADGMADLPGGLGLLTVAMFSNKPVYANGVFRSLGAYDASTGGYNGKIESFGVLFMPKRGHRKDNLRCFGFVCNRKLFKRLKSKFDDGTLNRLYKFNESIV